MVKIGKTRRVGGWAAASLMMMLGGCESFLRATPTDPSARAEQNAVERFFSPETQRGALFDPDTGSVIATEDRPEPGIRPRVLDTLLEEGQPQFRRYYERQLYGGLGRGAAAGAGIDPGAVTVVPGAAGTDAEPSISLLFENDSLDFVLGQILGGILGENYIATTAGAPPVTFRTQQPIPRSQLVPVLRDIVGRSGLVLRRINGIWHVAPPATMDVLTTMQASGQSADFLLDVIQLGGGSAEEVAPVIGALLPATARVVPVPSANSLVVAALPRDIAATRELVASLFGGDNGNDIVAIIPVNDSAPDQIAAELQAIFGPRAAGNPRLAVDILPLPQQQAILVRTATRRQLADVRNLVAQLDVDLRERPALRSIVLNYLDATETAEQLQRVLGDISAPVSVATSVPGDDGRSSRIVGALRNRQQFGTDGVVAQEEEAEAAETTGPQPPPLLRGRNVTRAVVEDDGFGVAAAEETAPPPPTVSVVADARSNALLVRSTHDDFVEIRRLVDALDVPLPQLVLEATILEVLLTDDLEYGVQFFLEENGIILRSSVGPGLGDPGLPGAVALASFGAFTGVNIDVLVTALQQVTDLRVISSPYVTVVSGENARLFVGDEIPFLIASQESSTDGTVTVTNEIETRETGIILDVQPVVRPDDSIRLAIVSEVSTPISTGTGNELTPTISRRSVTSDLAIQSGQTVLLGGLIQNRLEVGESGIPVLRNIPLFGNLFGVRGSNVRRTELLILLTPRAVRTSSEIQRVTRQLRATTIMN